MNRLESRQSFCSKKRSVKIDFYPRSSRSNPSVSNLSSWTLPEQMLRCFPFMLTSSTSG
ncbi:hypothetical protein F383_13693 [Gossypium arboreum]|uniref:Uncharacterized protein n=1 Tax=Gossypium arboreum TaxID=29729 RepID=A0A0B0PZP7_GOSAR|nr:hypothetical protein F383_13693 [Gossypium arboreum]